ncbi:FadR/GntR family transcriptional regulator [Desulfovibrio psychrotolerans]|uniref:GntR family transcriptional regulator n=1 Tax=Desulfovibrio psychrotolerans TaxID=415242 RepID=A0A7J0BW31_9BACT|nr:FadR/GntR family transcriptional regulator [Desulfovibrio psychrotolerans]GFM37919.1 GntR family transcriptional regulator [Desulfovibrio psychrotolerans]
MDTHNPDLAGTTGQTKIYERVVERIRELLESGEIKPGDKLPPERKLAEVFKVSRSSLREAIRALQENGVLESRRGDGTYVSLPPGGDLLAPFAEVMTQQRVRLWQLFQFRQAIEPQIARLAAESRTQGHLEALRQLLSMQEMECEGDENTGYADLHFHQLIAMATGNPLFLDVVTRAESKLAETRNQSLQSEERRIASLQAHRRILEAIEAGDPDTAELTMREHLSEVQGLVFDGDS